ncbi:MAG: glycosyltransferase, partial [Chloroflexota bacterium]
DGGDRYSSAPFHVAVIGSLDLGAPLRKIGWRVSAPAAGADGGGALDPSVEAVIVADHAADIRELPRRLVSLAWIRSDPERWLERPWFDDYDIVLVPDPATADVIRARSSKVATVIRPDATGEAIRDAIARWAASTRYSLRIGAPNRDILEQWGDYHFARALQRSLERAGHPTKLHLLPEWTDPLAAREDVAIHLFGLKEAPTRRSQVNLLWQISHPDLASPELYERYDHVFVASDRFAARMRPTVGVPVTPLHQATDPERFRPDPTGPRHDLLFVGNSRNVRRRIVDDVVETGHEIAIYGGGWRPELVDPRFVKADRIANEELYRYYSSAAIVLNDHWGDMLAEGFISNRLYDALACGAFVISDHLPELETEFDDAVVSYADRAELGALIDHYLADPAERRARGERGRRAVLARHTFDERAAILRETAAPLLDVAKSR